MKSSNLSIDRLIKIIQKLRSPNGCPWDIKQTNQTIKMDLIEEAYEVIDAINADCPESLKEELGDVLLQVIFHSQIQSEKNNFSFADVVDDICNKIIHRHPHVFGDEKIDSYDEVLKRWNEIKLNEKNKSLIDRVPKSIPALMRASEIQKRASIDGFDWNNISDVISKIDEEILELKDVIKKNDIRKIKDELGDVIFSLVNLSRHYNLNPEEILYENILKFETRLKFIQKKLVKKQVRLKDLSSEEINNLWNEAKANL